MNVVILLQNKYNETGGKKMFSNIVYLLLLTDQELSYDEYSQDFCIGFFLTQKQAEETARYYLKNIEGFCESLPTIPARSRLNGYGLYRAGISTNILMRQTLLKAIALCRTDVPNPYFTECSEPFNGQSGH